MIQELISITEDRKELNLQRDDAIEIQNMKKIILDF